jgi:hypothetical protein
MALFRKSELKSFFSKSIYTALFWGSLWGLAEATLGHILHWLRIPGLAGFVMFPLGVFFMIKAYQESNNLNLILATSMIAATFKLSNMLFPGTSPVDVLRPAIAILCESLVVFGLIFFVKIIFANAYFNRFDVKSGIQVPASRTNKRSAF